MYQRPSEVTQQDLFPGAPQTVPFNPNISVRPAIQPYLINVMGMLIYAIQLNANKNDMRRALFWTMIQNGYNNSEFLNLLQIACDLSELIAANNVPLESAVNQAVELVAAIKAATIGYKSGLATDMFNAGALTQSGYRDMEGLIQRGEQIMREISEFQNRYGGNVNQWNNNGMGGAWGGGQAYGRPVSPMAAQLSAGFGGAGSFQRQIPAYMENQQARVSRDFSGRGQPNQQPVDVQQNATVSRSNRIDWRNSDITISPKTAEAIAEKPPVKEITTQKAVIGEIRAKDSPVKPAFNTKSPYPDLYDPSVEEPFYVQAPNGSDEIIQIWKKKEKNVKYEDHKISHFFDPDCKLNAGYVGDPERARREFLKIATGRNLEELLSRLEEGNDAALEAEFIEKAVVVDIALIFAHKGVSPQEILLKWTESDVAYSTVTPKNTVTLNYCTVELQPVVDDAALALEELSNSTDMVMLAQRMRNIFGKIPEDLWNRLHRQITDHVNEILEVGLNTSYHISSVVDDMPDLVSGISKKYGAAYLELFMSRGRVVAQTNVYLIKDDLPADALDMRNTEGKSIVYGLGSLHSITFIQAHSRDFNIESVQRFGLVRESKHPELHRAVKRILDNSIPNALDVRLVTTDGKEIYLHRGMVGEDTYLVSRRP